MFVGSKNLSSDKPVSNCASRGAVKICAKQLHSHVNPRLLVFTRICAVDGREFAIRSTDLVQTLEAGRMALQSSRGSCGALDAYTRRIRECKIPAAAPLLALSRLEVPSRRWFPRGDRYSWIGASTSRTHRNAGSKHNDGGRDGRR